MAAATPVTANAATIRFAFTGTATAQSGLFTGQGSGVQGFLTYESGLADSAPGNNSDLFSSGGANSSFNDTWEIQVTNGSITRTSRDNQRTVGTIHHDLALLDATGEDSFVFRALRTVVTDDLFRFVLRDGLPTPAPDGIAGGSGSLTGVAWMESLDVSLFSGFTDSKRGLVQAFDNSSAAALGSLEFGIETFALVPEPSNALLLALGLGGLGCVRKQSPLKS